MLGRHTPDLGKRTEVFDHVAKGSWRPSLRSHRPQANGFINGARDFARRNVHRPLVIRSRRPAMARLKEFFFPHR
jgi:hypothetical protein